MLEVLLFPLQSSSSSGLGARCAKVAVVNASENQPFPDPLAKNGTGLKLKPRFSFLRALCAEQASCALHLLPVYCTAGEGEAV